MSQGDYNIRIFKPADGSCGVFDLETNVHKRASILLEGVGWTQGERWGFKREREGRVLGDIRKEGIWICCVFSVLCVSRRWVKRKKWQCFQNTSDTSSSQILHNHKHNKRSSFSAQFNSCISIFSPSPSVLVAFPSESTCERWNLSAWDLTMSCRALMPSTSSTTSNTSSGIQTPRSNGSARASPLASV